ncbi:MAG: hypothetical protein AB1641_20340 [Thermodesulfobacteriota bacterium]
MSHPLTPGVAPGLAIFNVLNLLDIQMGPASSCLKGYAERFFASTALTRQKLKFRLEELIEDNKTIEKNKKNSRKELKGII